MYSVKIHNALMFQMNVQVTETSPQHCDQVAPSDYATSSLEDEKKCIEVCAKVYRPISPGPNSSQVCGVVFGIVARR